ncbi:16S rRNA (guanine(527)-N(7))-methyltransferase RsmG [Bifidobacterium saimiriisciurei]|uniref:Ribosomal RNA small subunit methyltransferase G n=1 Tax=Bifidobacterium saimiriisciurei TaxID=2661627 RepID=A0ABX0CB88_9BIFI|nr:16S rRNA (guanine(527)-N(7))-methyltransferase RsmG [Bifidobacterium saimiriisciurei]NEH11682.1 16S rRNA (guanine(527)-N(7))-methyltransferase RsmG [Bifidobacterium saimiriisciurei]
MTDQLEGSPLIAEVLGPAAEPLAKFHAKLEKEGEPRGLIGPRDVDILWERHILNSAAVVPFILEALGAKDRESATGRLADVGSGGGFPGIIVAACLPNVKVSLIEPMERRVDWLSEVVVELGLKNVRIVHARAEDAVKPGAGFDVVTCRAIAPMRKLAGFTMPLLRPGGRLVALKGKSAQAEIDKGMKLILRAKGVNPRVVEAPVADGLESTHVVLVDKK